jgi:hypothetical protein
VIEPECSTSTVAVTSTRVTVGGAERKGMGEVEKGAFSGGLLWKALAGGGGARVGARGGVF